MITAQSQIARLLTARFKLAPDRASELANRLIELAQEPWPIFETAKDRKALEELARAVKTIQRVFKEELSEVAVGALQEHLFWGDSVENIARKNAAAPEEELLSKIVYLHEMQAPSPERLSLVKVAHDANPILAAIARTSNEASGSAGRLKPVNRPEVQAVDAARIVWEIAGRKAAPAKDLAPNSPFDNFLQGVFTALELSGQVKSAFRAWVRETQKSPDRW